MNNSQPVMIASAIEYKWIRWGAFYKCGEELQEQQNSLLPIYMTYEVDGGYRLTDAGAFRVLVECQLILTPNMHSRTHGDCFACGGVLGKSPHEAVAQAALAQLEEG